MSQFLNSPEAVFNAGCVFTHACRYIVGELIDPSFNSAKLSLPVIFLKDAGEEMIGILFENFNHRLRMYGSARELTENVKIFGNFPETSVARMLPYYTTPVIYKSLKGNEYIYKQHAYVLLNYMTLEAYPFEKSQMLRSLISMFIRSQEVENLKKLEFVKFDQKAFDEIYKEIEQIFENFKTDTSEFENLVSNLKLIPFPLTCDHIESLIPTEWKDNERNYLQNELVKYVAEFSDVTERTNHLAILCSTTDKIVKILRKIIDNRVEIFKSQDAQITVRLFEDGDDQFVMKAELMEAISRSKKSKNHYKDEGVIIDTMDMKDVVKNYGDQIQTIEFIRTPIIRAKHKVTPVVVGEELCSLAVDALFDFMKGVIFEMKLYQKCCIRSFDESHRFGFLESAFDPNRKTKFFVTLQGIANLKSVFNKKEAFYAQIPTNEIQNVTKDGFSAKDLENTLYGLNLKHAFLEIPNYAEIVYSEVDKRKKEPVLRTCDLFDAIEQCQLISIFRRLPSFRQFLHNQKGCHRIYGLKCERCEIEEKLRKESQDPKIISNNEPDSEHPNTTMGSAPESENLAPKMLEVVSEDKKTCDSSEAAKESLEAPKTSESKESKKKTSKATPDVKKSPEAKSTPPDTQKQKSKASQPKNPSLDPQKPSESQQKTSANCDKCYRTCEMLNETKRELKTSENKLKNMEKKMLGKEREMDELKKNEMEKIEEKEKEIEKRLEEIQGLEMRIQEKEEQNRNLNRQISELKSNMEKEREDEKNVLEEQVFRLEKKLEEERKKSDEEIRGLKTEIQETNRKMGELKEREIRIGAENEVNERMIQQLLNKLTPPPPSQFRIHSSSSSSQRVEKCEICWKETNESIIRCQKCRRPFHDKCATQWLNDYLNCPACDEEFVKL